MSTFRLTCTPTSLLVAFQAGLNAEGGPGDLSLGRPSSVPFAGAFAHESGGRLEVKQSAAAQAWKSAGRRNPARFDIAPRTGYWDQEEDWVPKPGRHADLYVFAWHGADKSTADQRDAGGWEFYVVAKRDLPEQKSIALKALQGLASPCGIDALAAAVDAVTGQPGR